MLLVLVLVLVLLVLPRPFQGRRGLVLLLLVLPRPFQGRRGLVLLLLVLPVLVLVLRAVPLWWRWQEDRARAKVANCSTCCRCCCSCVVSHCCRRCCNLGLPPATLPSPLRASCTHPAACRAGHVALQARQTHLDTHTCFVRYVLREAGSTQVFLCAGL